MAIPIRPADEIDAYIESLAATWRPLSQEEIDYAAARLASPTTMSQPLGVAA